ncbi:MAG: hypothetical protein Q7R81_05770 [Candidatus Peregrinibacteria bacterium]|nr:hypothetical protein [Candidatus Peregrinibacteria bacterium]
MQKACAKCGTSFTVTDGDLAFFESVSPTFQGKKYTVPPPASCPDCRFQERLIWRPELHLFQRKSDLSGQQMLSKYPPEAPCKVYSPEEWWSDSWNPLDYGRDYDFQRPFFDQFRDLLREVPLIALSVSGNVNSDYINSASWCKNCYLISGANHNEDCYYGNFVNYCINCMDCSFIDHCQLCYECIDCAKCYNLHYSQNCSNCYDSSFLYSCRGCKHCFGSVNLVEKEYVYKNKQLTKDEYEERFADLQLHSRSRVAEASVFFDKHQLQYPHKFMIGEMNEDVTGNGILRSRRVYESFDVSDSEDCKYCSWFHQAKNCMDCYAWGFPAEECYSCMEVGNDSHRVLFSLLTYNGADLLYSYSCRQGCQHLFGCVSLRRSSYCIFNKQYTKDEYERLASRIIEHMQNTGEWGQFLPMSLCPLAYNQTIAQDYFPITKERAGELGARWSDQEAPQSPKISVPVPDSIQDTSPDICSKILTCVATRKPYKVTLQEYNFSKTNGIPLADKSFFARHEARLRRRNPRKLWDRKCAQCQKAIRTSFAQDRPEIVFCEQCYLKEVY